MINSRNYIKKASLSSKSQSGLSLIELLIAMVIGLFLLVGITTSYLSSKKSSIKRDQVSLLQDNGRVALEILTNTLQHAGYRSTGLAVLDNPFMSTAGKPTPTSCGPGITSVSNTDFPNDNINDEDGGDTIGIFYLGDKVLNTDCSGEPLPVDCRVGGSAAADAHKIFNTFFLDASDRTLQCAGSSSTTGNVVIAEGVENMQILYGINADDDPLKSVERYVKGADVGPDWGLVVSIQVAILVRTQVKVKDKPESQSFTLLDKEVNSPTDRYQRAVFSTSINLRNL